MAQPFSRKPFRFVHGGIDLSNPIDLVPEGRYVILSNIRSYFEGTLQARPGLTAINTSGTSIHSIKRLNDLIAASYARILGTGTILTQGTTSFSSVATGFSGSPFTSVILSPKQTSKPWCYLTEGTKQVKTRVGLAAAFNWGIAAPVLQPSIVFGVPALTTISDAESVTNWLAGGTGGAVANASRVNTTIARIVYESGSTGWASVEPTSTAGINEGMFLIAGAAETVIVDMVIPAAPTTTIAAISYDSGSTGACSIQLTASPGHNHLTKGSLLTLDTENVIVRDVIYGPDDIPCIRTITTGVHAAAETVTGRPAFRAYFTTTRVAADALTSNMNTSAVTTGIGFLDYTAAVDASVASSRPIDMENDEVHVSILISDLTLLTEAKVMFDVDLSTNDFTKNYFVKSLEPSEFVGVTDDSVTMLAAKLTRLQRKLTKAVQNGNFDRAERLRTRIENLEAEMREAEKIPIESYTTLGANQWTELRFKVKDMLRVGADGSRTLKNIAKTRIQVNITGAVDLKVDAIWIGGTYGPDIGNRGAPYRYGYRYRSSETGATSAWSPLSWTGLNAHRQRINITPTASSDTQVDKIDYARTGGAYADWRMIGTGTNSGSFNDDQSDLSITQAVLADLDIFQPWCVTDVPKTGVCNVAGVTVTWVSGDAFDTSWAENVIIVVNNIAYTLHGPPLSTTKLHLNENAGAQTSVPFYIPSPLKTGQPLPSVFGPIGYGESGLFVFGVGSSLEPGALFWTVGNDPDAVHDYNVLQVSSPSEPLVAGGVFDGRAFVLSTEGAYQIFPNFSSETAAFVVQRVPDSKGMLGLIQNTAIAIGPKVWYRGKDGIYETVGGEPIDITEEQLYSLFPHDGQPGVTINGYIPPDDTKAQHLNYYDGFLYYDYIDTSNNPITLVYDTLMKRWCIDTYTTVRPLIHYGEEGSEIHSILVGGENPGSTGKLWQQLGVSDDTVAIAGHVRTMAFDAGDPRAKKLWGDTLLDTDPAGATLNVLVGFDNYATLEASQTMTGSGRQQQILNIQSGLGKLAKNQALDIAWSSSTVVPILYLWEPSFVSKPEDTTTRTTDPDDLGSPHAKFVQGFRIHCDTFNTAKTFSVQSDTGSNGAWVTQQSFTLTSNGESVQAFSFDTPFITHLIRIITTDSDPWMMFSYDFVWNEEPELVEEWITQQSANQGQGYGHIKGLYITHMSTANLSLILTVDGVAQAAITIAHTAGLRQKTWVPIPAIKGKVFEYKITSATGFRLYRADCETRFKSWGTNQAYQVATPFGDIHMNRGATI